MWYSLCMMKSCYWLRCWREIFGSLKKHNNNIFQYNIYIYTNQMQITRTQVCTVINFSAGDWGLLTPSSFHCPFSLYHIYRERYLYNITNNKYDDSTVKWWFHYSFNILSPKDMTPYLLPHSAYITWCLKPPGNNAHLFRIIYEIETTKYKLNHSSHHNLNSNWWIGFTEQLCGAFTDVSHSPPPMTWTMPRTSINWWNILLYCA